MRLRILRLTLDRALTNKEMAERLGRDPGTVLHHVRVLVRGGFLEAGKVRPGKRGALERPYRATGKSWRIRMRQGSDYTASVLDAVRDEIEESDERAALSMVRLGVRLTDADIEDLRHRVGELGDEFVLRDDPAGTPIGIMALVYKRRP
ncbi:MAG TPA: helix-turn-helix domain-containing protein [Candidatus Limnocylindrales bacterium]|jgi:predicted ArsR family transcriptional regulator